MGRRHADVHDHELGLVLTHETEEVVGVACLTDDLEAGPFEEAREPLAEKDVVVGQDDTTVAIQRRMDDPSTLRRVAR